MTTRLTSIAPLLTVTILVSAGTSREKDGPPGAEPPPVTATVPVAFLSGGGLAVVTPVQDARHDRFGFSWWTLEAR